MPCASRSTPQLPAGACCSPSVLNLTTFSARAESSSTLVRCAMRPGPAQRDGGCRLGYPVTVLVMLQLADTRAPVTSTGLNSLDVT